MYHTLGAAAAALFAGFLYSIYVPVPPGLTKKTTNRIIFAILRLFDLAGDVVELFGICDRVTLFTKLPLNFKLKDEELQKAVKSEDLLFDSIKVRMFIPNSIENKTDRSGVMHYHGGGWVLGDVDMFDLFSRKVARDLGVVLVSVEYRLAPEHPFPIPFEDCLNATKYFLRNASMFGVNPDRVAVMGDSAGGNLSAAVCLALRDESFTPMIRAQALIYPATQAINFSLPSYQQNRKGPMLSRRFMIVFYLQYAIGKSATTALCRQMESYSHVTSEVKHKMAASHLNLKRVPQRMISSGYRPKVTTGNWKSWNKLKDVMMNPYYAPLMANDLASLPPAYIYTAQYDILRDEGIMYAERLKEAGNEVLWCHGEQAGYHGIMNILGIKSNAETKQAYEQMIEFLKGKII